MSSLPFYVPLDLILPFCLTAPPDDTFKGYLPEYNRNNITSWAEIMRRLADDHGIKIG